MKLTELSSRTWAPLIFLLFVNISVLLKLPFPTFSSISVFASSPVSSCSEDPQDIIQILSTEDQNKKCDSLSNSPFESIWKTFKEVFDSTTKNVLSSSSSSSAGDPSNIDHDSMVRSNLQMKDEMLNRRVHLMEQTLNGHYTQQFLDLLPQLKEFGLNFERQEDKSLIEEKPDQTSASESSFLRWKQPDTLTGETTCYCFSESPGSYWSFQWCPQKEIIYQGRRKSNGMLQPEYNLGTRYMLENVGKTENLEATPESTSDVHYLVTTANENYPFAVATVPYVNGDTCVEGGTQRRTSVIVLHDNTSSKCSTREGKQMIIESVVEVRVCHYMFHVCIDRRDENVPKENKIGSSKNSSDNRNEAATSPKQNTYTITDSGVKAINETLYYIKNQITASFTRKLSAGARGKSRENVLTPLHSAMPPLPQTRIEANLKLIKEMFVHAYDSYMYHGFPASEVKPISCAPATFNLVKIPGLTLIDSLDTLVILGNYTEFARAVERLRFLNDNMYDATGIQTNGGGIFSINQNVSVFETNIRVLGGLLSGHQLAVAFLEGKVLEAEVWAEDKSILMGVHQRSTGDCKKNEDIVSAGFSSNSEAACQSRTDQHWEYDGFLLELARDIGDRLLPAFNTLTGIPYGTVNLLSGIPKGETPIASLAGGGTLSLEMELLGRLTGNSDYGRAAKLAARALWMRRSPLGILGKHICTKKGEWTETLSGIGSNSDSFYEYLIKHHILFPEDSDFWLQLVAAYGGVHNETRVGEWYGDVEMYRGRSQTGAPRRVLEALMAFYPGMQVLLGEVTPAARTLNSFFLVREYLGFLPERFQFGSWKVDHGGGNHLLRPELLESAYFLHRSSKGFQNQFRSNLKNITKSDSSGWVWSGDFALHTIEKFTRTECGYGSLRDVSPETSGIFTTKRSEIRLLDEMPSYFLSETLKYLYLLFDDNNILHTDPEHDWVFTTEAHPIHHEQKEASADAKLTKQKDELKLRIQRRLEKRKKPVNDLRKGLVNEKWTKLSNMGDFVQQLEHIMKSNRKIFENLRSKSFLVPVERIFPHDNSPSPFDLFNERFQMLNPTFLTFRKLGNELRITNSCPNLYASDYLWIRALNGGIADYSDSYKSRLNDDFVVSERDIIQLGSIDALALHGTGAHIKSLYDAFFQLTIRDERTVNKGKRSSRSESEKLQRELSSSSTRFEMADGMGSFDVAAFPGGSGFFVQHVESGENIVTTLIEEEISSKGPLILVYSKSGTGNTDADSFVEKTVASRNSRAVVLADLHGNSFSCEVQVVESKVHVEEDPKCEVDLNEGSGDDFNFNVVRKTEDKILGRFPCSPALFGPTHISHLEKVKNIEVEAKIKPSSLDDMQGCGHFSMNPASKGIDNKSETSATESSASSCPDISVDNKMQELLGSHDRFVSIVERGGCTFQEKSFLQKLTERAEGVIVINNDKGDDLFVMSGGGSAELANLALHEYPVTVLVTWDDGRNILKMMEDHEKSGNTQVNAKISIVQDQFSMDEDLIESTSASKFWPRVKASSDALQIYSHSGWGIHAVQIVVDDKNQDAATGQLQWQLYLLKHDMVEEIVP